MAALPMLLPKKGVLIVSTLFTKCMVRTLLGAQVSAALERQGHTPGMDGASGAELSPGQLIQMREAGSVTPSVRSYPQESAQPLPWTAHSHFAGVWPAAGHLCHGRKSVCYRR